MHKAVIPFDISNMPPLMKLAEDVQKTQTPRLLKRDDQVMAILMPVTPPFKAKKRAMNKAKYEAFEAAAGSWSDIDVDQFKADIAASRKMYTRPSVEL